MDELQKRLFAYLDQLRNEGVFDHCSNAEYEEIKSNLLDICSAKQLGES